MRIELNRGVPGILLLPDELRAPVPAVLLLHGLTSDKERMASTAGAALLRHGIASLSIDLPLHGERRESGTWSRSTLALIGAWRTAQRDARDALDWLAARPEIDPLQLGLVGYSMGSYLGLTVAATAQHIRAIVVAAGGDLPNDTPYTRLLRTVADPIRAIRRVAGRPLLIVHGRHDRTVTPAQAQRLFDAAEEPKQLEWWDVGHYLPDAAITHAASWLARQLSPGSQRAEPVPSFTG